MMRCLVLLVIFLRYASLIALAATTEEDRKCWFHNDREAPDDVPCSDNYYTYCCQQNEVCLSNGLCMNTGHQPYVLARRSCTDREWKTESNCTRVCENNNPSGGSTVSLATEDGDKKNFTYCCGQPVAGENGNATCDGHDPFPVDDGDMLYGYAALENVTATAPSSNKKEVAIGVGVGVPLGVIAASAIAWAIWERLQRKKALGAGTGFAIAAGAAAASAYQPVMKPDSYMPAAQNVPASAPVELEHRSRPIPELQGSHRM